MSDLSNPIFHNEAAAREWLEARVWPNGRVCPHCGLDGKRTAINSFILLLATGDETLGPFLMNSTCARELCALLVAEGFGPQAT